MKINYSFAQRSEDSTKFKIQYYDLVYLMLLLLQQVDQQNIKL